MRTAACLFGALLLLGCSPDEPPPHGDGNGRPGAAQEDSGNDSSPAGSGSENAAPPLRPVPRSPDAPGSPPR